MTHHLIVGDTICQDRVDRDTAVIARIFTFVNILVNIAATLIYKLDWYQSCGEFEVFIALLDVAMTASWVCVCLIPLELYCARKREESQPADHGEEKPHAQGGEPIYDDEKQLLLEGEIAPLS